MRVFLSQAELVNIQMGLCVLTARIDEEIKKPSYPSYRADDHRKEVDALLNKIESAL